MLRVVVCTLRPLECALRPTKSKPKTVPNRSTQLRSTRSHRSLRSTTHLSSGLWRSPGILPRLHLLLKLQRLLLELRHLLLVKLELLIGVTQNKADVASDGPEAQQLAAAIERAFGANRVLFGRIVIADFQRKCGIDEDTVLAALFNLRVDGDRQLTRQMDDNVAVIRLKVAGPGSFRRANEPCGDAAIAGGSFYGAINLREIDAAAGGFQIGRPEKPHHANSSAARFRAHKSSSLADLNFAAAGFRGEVGAGMFKRDVSAAGFEMGHALNRSNANMSAAGVERGASCDGTDHDVAAAGIRVELARNALGDDIAAAGFKARGTANISGSDVATRG